MSSKHLNLQSFSLVIALMSAAIAWGQNNSCISYYSSNANTNSVNLMDKLNTELQSNPGSHPMMTIYAWINKEFNSLGSDYNDFLISLKKVGVDNKLKSNLQIANALYEETINKLQDINTELDKKERSHKKVTALSEALKHCSLKAETCMNDLKESVDDSLNQIEKIKKLSKAIYDNTQALENMKAELNKQDLNTETKEMALQAIQGQINKFASYLSLTENFKDQLNKSLASALFYIHDTYPQLLHELKVADAKGAELDLLVKNAGNESVKPTIPPEILQKKISLTTEKIIEELSFKKEENLKKALWNGLTSKESKTLFWNNVETKNVSQKFEVQDLIKLFDTYLSKSTDLNIKLKYSVGTYKIEREFQTANGEHKYYEIDSLNTSLTNMKNRFTGRSNILIPTFLLLLLSSNDSKNTVILAKYFHQRLQEVHDHLVQELQSSKSSDGFFYFMNSEKREHQAELKKKLNNIKLAIKVFSEEASMVESDLSFFKTHHNPIITLDNIMIRINTGAQTYDN